MNCLPSRLGQSAWQLLVVPLLVLVEVVRLLPLTLPLRRRTCLGLLDLHLVLLYLSLYTDYSLR